MQEDACLSVVWFMARFDSDSGIGCSQVGPVEGAIFADYGSDLGSGSTVPGNYP